MAPLDQTLRAILGDVLALPADRVQAFTDATPLFGALPELDSLAVAGLLTEIEERLDVRIDEDALAIEDFATFGSLLALVERAAPA